MVMTMTLAAIAAMADAQADFNRYIKAYNQQVASRQYEQAARSASSAAMICASAKNYDGAFKLLSGLDKIIAEHTDSASQYPKALYYTAKARYDLYEKMDNKAQAEAWLKKMAGYAKTTGDREITNSMLFTEAQFYYSTGRTALADKCIARLIKQYENGSDYKAADTAYQQLIDQAVSANDAGLVERTYESYMQWSDSIEALQADSELGKVKREMAETEAEVAQKQSTINSRTSLMVIFITLFIIAVAALGLGAVFYMRVLSKNRKIKRMAREAEERTQAKSEMLQNMSSTLEPALDSLDQSNPAVQTIKGYMRKVGELSEVDNAPAVDPSMLSEVNIEQLGSRLANEVRSKLKKGVALNIDGMRGMIHTDADGLEKILSHLLDNAAKYTPEGGRITLAYRKRGANSHQFVVSDNGPGIPEADRAGLFRPFDSAHDLTEGGDRLGLPICALRAEKMGGTLTLDPSISKGASFILSLHT